MNKSLICIASGGTGGHVMPAVSMAHEILKTGHPVLLATDQRGYQYWPQVLQHCLHVLPAANVRKSGLISKIMALVKMVSGLCAAIRFLYHHRPRMLVTFGGYPTVMPLIAAKLLRIPITLVELDNRVGIVNRLFYKKARLCLSAFDTKNKSFIHVGLPVRPHIDRLANISYHSLYAQSPIHILIIGGSQGARVFSHVIPKALALLPQHIRERLKVVHQAHAITIEDVSAIYEKAQIACEVQPFFTDMDKRLSEAHVVITRSGASTLAELAITKRPAILIPFPHAAGNHQHKNALPFAEAGAAWLMEEKDFTPTKLAYIVNNLFTQPGKLEHASHMIAQFAKPHAAEKMAALICKALKGKS